MTPLNPLFGSWDVFALAEIKAHAKLKNFDLVRLPRLSIMPVSEEQWRIIEEMAQK